MEELISGVSDQDVLVLVNLEDFDSLHIYIHTYMDWRTCETHSINIMYFCKHANQILLVQHLF